MKVVRENTTLVQTSELRTKLEEVLKRTKSSRVVLEKHHKPVAVLVDPEEFERMEEALESLSDILLALEAHEREKKTPRTSYIPLEVIEKKYLH